MWYIAVCFYSFVFLMHRKIQRNVGGSAKGSGSGGCKKFKPDPWFLFFLVSGKLKLETEVLLIKCCLSVEGREVGRWWFMAKYYSRCWMP